MVLFSDISGTKYIDANGNGSFDGGEVGLEGVRIYVDFNDNGEFDDDGGPLGSSERFDTTDEDGYWEIENLGLLQVDKAVREVVPEGFTQTGQEEYTTTGQDQTDLNFFNFEKFDIEGMKFNDANGNGQDDDDDGLGGVRIYVDLNGNDQYDGGEPTDETAGDGSWEITDLEPEALGKAVREVVPTGFTQTGPVEYDLPATSQDQTELNFFNFEKFDISGTKFVDANGNGQDDDDDGLGGVRIYVDLNGNDQYDGGEPTDETAGDGSWEITDLEPEALGKAVREVVPTGYFQSGPVEYDLPATSQDQSGLNFFNYEESSISGYKFNDLNGNGTWEFPYEPGLDGWEIRLSGTDGMGNPVARATTTSNGATDANGDGDVDILDFGYYEFADLAPGDYEITETLQAGWAQSAPAGDSFDLTVESGDELTDNNFGNYEESSISGYKFNDLNGNSIWDFPYEPGLEGWEITLSGTDGMGNPVARATTTSDGTTDANGDGDINILDFGYYEFADLAPGNYDITETPQAGWAQTAPEGDSFNLWVEGGDELTDNNFGNYEESSISGYKFNDLNGNGTWDFPYEPGLEGWEIKLTGTDGMGNLVELMTTTSDGTTDANGDGDVDILDFGYYEFADLAPGNYDITETPQDGWAQTAPEGDSFNLWVEGGDELTDNNFGNYEESSISGYKFNDLNNNSNWDFPFEPGLDGWEIKLSGTDGMGNPVERMTTTSDGTTDANGDGNVNILDFGYYEFADLAPGNYDISETLQEGWAQTAPEGDSFNLWVEGGDELTDNNFGNFQTDPMQSYLEANALETSV